ncbi:hypothetical protein D3C72_2355540 [compost metagenome]
MMVRVRSRSPKPPSQASALSARPSRCKPPLSTTQTLKRITACSNVGVPSNSPFNAHSNTPNSSPTSG